MIQIKKTILTLVLLLTAVGGAWAESKPIGLNVEYAVGDVITTNSTGDVYVWWGIYSTGGENYEWVIKITSSVTPTISKLGIDESSGFITLDNDYAVYNMNGNIEANSYKIQCQGKVTGTTLEKVYVASGSGTLTDPYVFAPGSAPAATSATPVTVAWDKAKKTGTFTMPGGNVTLEPEYYPQAALTAAPTAINDVPATTDGAIVKAGTVATIGSTETAQGTVMYYVSTTALNDAALLALDADAWTADVPTAESLAEGKAYVYYYVRGNDSDNDEENFSDGDILAANALTVTIAAEPTYAVTFAEGVNPEPPAEPEWTASPATDVKKGTPVTVTYSGERKVMGVKAEKKAAAGPKDAKDATAEDLGKVIGADGNIYDDADAATAANTTAVAMIAYVGDNGEDAPYNHGLALALTDESSTMKWEAAKTACNTTKNTSIPVTNARWLLASKDQWGYMSSAVLSNIGLLITKYYWSSTYTSTPFLQAWAYKFSNNSWNQFSGSNDGASNCVRACLAF